ncbi:MAG: hypothetical protein JWO42_852, partial [Chloroflexi bacterium]|nr:hypothetical protein [Chloroflexota bacterium]
MLVIAVAIVWTVAFTLQSVFNQTSYATTTASVSPTLSTKPAVSSSMTASATAKRAAQTATAPANTATPASTATPAATVSESTATPVISIADNAVERAAEMLATLQLGYTPKPTDPTVRAFSRDLAAMQPLCNATLLGLAGDIVNTHNRLQSMGAQGDLLNTASQLQAFVVNAAKTQSTAPPFPCSTLFGTFGAPGGST